MAERVPFPHVKASPTTRAGRRLISDLEQALADVELRGPDAYGRRRALAQLVREGVILAEQEARTGR